MAGVEIAIGIALMLIMPVDVFLTVLYARIGSAAPGRLGGGGIVSPWIGRGVWAAFRRLGPREGDRRDAVFSFCGPTVVVALLLPWALLPIVGAALVVHPALGTAVRSRPDAARDQEAGGTADTLNAPASFSISSARIASLSSSTSTTTAAPLFATASS